MYDSLLPIILNLVFKRPLIGIPLLLVGGFFLFKMGALGGGGNSSSLAQLATGAEMKQEVYDKSQVAAALAEDEKIHYQNM